MSSAPTARSPAAKNLFADLPASPESHFRIYFFGAVLLLIDRLANQLGPFKELVQRFPFLSAYNNLLAERIPGMMSDEAMATWWQSLEVWELNASAHLPLRKLREVFGFDHVTIAWLIVSGLVEEDSGFGSLFESLHHSASLRRPTFGLMQRLWPHPAADAISTLTALRNAELIDVPNPEAPRQDWVLQMPSLIWDGFRGAGGALNAASLRFRACDQLPLLDELILDPNVQKALHRALSLLKAGEVKTLVVRGPQHNGRHTAIGAVARGMGLGILEVRGQDRLNARQWQRICTLALLLDAMPILQFDAAPGEIIDVPEIHMPPVPLGIVMGRQGGLNGALASSITIQIGMPDAETRARL